MVKLVNESLENYLAERDSDSSHGIITYALTAPARALRRTRAESIMNKYKSKVIKRIDELFIIYRQNLEKTINRTKTKINQIQGYSTAAFNDHKSINKIKSSQYDTLLNELRQNIETQLRSAREGANKVIKTYSDSINQRINSKGTVTGVEFHQNDKTILKDVWAKIEEEIDIYIEEKLIDLIELNNVNELTTLKTELKQYIEELDPYKSSYTSGGAPAKLNLSNEDYHDLKNQDEIDLYDYLKNNLGVNLDFRDQTNNIKVIEKGKEDKIYGNKPPVKHLILEIRNGELGYRLLGVTNVKGVLTFVLTAYDNFYSFTGNYHNAGFKNAKYFLEDTYNKLNNIV